MRAAGGKGCAHRSSSSSSSSSVWLGLEGGSGLDERRERLSGSMMLLSGFFTSFALAPFLGGIGHLEVS